MKHLLKITSAVLVLLLCALGGVFLWRSGFFAALSSQQALQDYISQLKMSEFNKQLSGVASETEFTKERLAGLSIFLRGGGVDGKECEPIICMDNIRVVPVE